MKEFTFRYTGYVRVTLRSDGPAQELLAWAVSWWNAARLGPAKATIVSDSPSTVSLVSRKLPGGRPTQGQFDELLSGLRAEFIEAEPSEITTDPWRDAQYVAARVRHMELFGLDAIPTRWKVPPWVGWDRGARRFVVGPEKVRPRRT